MREPQRSVIVPRGTVILALSMLTETLWGNLSKHWIVSETFRQFSRIVDESIREACFAALNQILKPEIDKVREASEQQGHLEPLPADILLLGGDDLLVAVPADRALDFALMVTNAFERLTKEKIADLPDADTQFFRDRLGSEGFTISCGVAVARSNYPFYLAFDLARTTVEEC